MPAKRPRTGGQPAAGQKATILDFLHSATRAGATSSQPAPGASCPELAVTHVGRGQQLGEAAAGGSQQADWEQRRDIQVGLVVAGCSKPF